MDKKSNLIWLDLEMTGLDPESQRIIEIATVVTDKDLNVLAHGPNIVINQPKALMDAMDDWCTNQHGGSGLTQKVLDSDITTVQAEQLSLDFIAKYVEAGASPMCGNSIGQDRRFLVKYMPTFEAYFHYRNLDVSTLKELARRWKPEVLELVVKKGSHLALDDTLDSIDELKVYREHLMKL
ncbi:oligoribonuclease [Marinicellulosiphila megalodicopiae]|uniref:oligoribonuclease n=1 Tax=Marinicellulosiphila megalodicopiae TaxID=2724896 RepID=UPI003BB09FE4